jgi:hypothetical protein
VCKRTFEACIDPNPCVILAATKVKPEEKALVNCLPDASSPRGFGCIGPTDPPTPMPATPMPGAPTPPGSSPVKGDTCKDEPAECLPNQFATVAGCPCINGNCTGTDSASGLVLGCNRATQRCAPCMASKLFCKCGPGGACDANLACIGGQCMPAQGFTIDCPIKGAAGCPCTQDKCAPSFACSSQLSRCVACPPGCKESCAKTSVGRNDTCAGKSTSCQDCKADMQCNWCGSTQGCRPNKCDDGSSGMAFCASCARLSECNGAGECIGPDQCRCMTGFKADATLGCVPADQAAPQPTESGDSAIAIYAGAGAGGAVLLCLIVGIVVYMQKNKKSKDPSAISMTSTGGAGGSAADQPAAALGMFSCSICGKAYNFQTDVETHMQMRHGANGAGGTMSGNTFTTAPAFDSATAFGGPQSAFYDNQNGGSFNGGNSFVDPYQQQQNMGYQQQQSDGWGGQMF